MLDLMQINSLMPEHKQDALIKEGRSLMVNNGKINRYFHL